jgi:hypothetical protein
MAVTGRLIETAPYHNAETGGEESAGRPRRSGKPRRQNLPNFATGGVDLCFFSFEGSLGI